MSNVIVKGEPDPIDDRINEVLKSSFSPEPKEEKTTPEKEVETQPEEKETPEVADGEQEEKDEDENNNDVEEKPTKKPSRAEKRIRELNESKKEAEARAHALELQVAEMKPYLEMLKSQTSEKVKEAPILPQEYDTQEEFASAILARAKEELRKEIQGELQPIQFNLKDQQYKAQINNWFNANPEALEVKGAMDKISEKFDPETRSVYEKQILAGDPFILDALYAMVKPGKVDNISLLNKARTDAQDKASVGTGKKSTKSSKVVNSEDSLQRAKKGDVNDWLKDKFMTMEQNIK